MSFLSVFRVALAIAVLAPAARGGGQTTPARTDTLFLSLDAAVTRAVRQSDEMRLARAQVDVANAQITVARASVIPQLRITGNYNHVIENARAQAVGQIFNQPNTYNTNAILSQTLFQGGREFAGMRLAARSREAAEESEVETRSLTTVSVQRAYLQVLYADRIIQIQEENYKLSAERVAQVEQLEAAGRAARYDVLRARVQRSNLEPTLIQSRSDRTLAMLELKRVLNIPLEQPVALTTSLDAAAVQPFVTSFVEQAAARAAVRPAVRAAELTARARRDAVSVARADLFPTISASISNGYQAFPVSGLPPLRGRVSNDFCPDGSAANRTCNNGGFFNDRAVNVQMSWPIFDGLRSRGAIESAHAQARIADLQLAQTRENVAVEQARSRAELERARATFEARKQNVSEANEAYQLAALRFSRGLSTQLDVSDAQLALLTAQTNEARAVYDLYLASAELARTLGLPIPMPPSVPVPGRPTP